MALHDHDTTRRSFLKAGAATAAAVSGATTVRAADEAGKAAAVLPTRKLGRSGVPVSVLNLGTAFRLTPRMLDYAYNAGIRYLDTADCYEKGGSEREIAKWLKRTGHRKDMFIVTKCHPTEGPKQMLKMVDERLAALETDYIDLLFIHELCDGEYPEACVDWPAGDEFKETAEALKKSGKCKLVGFSVHAERRAQALENAAKGGFLDAIMLKYDPRTAQNDKMNAAIDKCHKAGIGLIAMKTQSSAKAFKDRWEKLTDSGITVQQAVVKAVLADERLAGMTSHMVSTKMIDENTAMARDSKPLARADRDLLLDLFAQGPHYLCDKCNGECALAVGRPNALHDVARCVMYYERYGQRRMAREVYHGLPLDRLDLSGEELARATAACADRLNYAEIFAKAQRYFA